jgi:hypothetical protein
MATNEELRERVKVALRRAWQKHGGLLVAEVVDVAEDVLAELAPELRHEPPEGCEAVYLPTTIIDYYASTGELVLKNACRATVAARPQPESKTERVLGQITEVGSDLDSGPWAKAEALGCTWGMKVDKGDGTVEVVK